MEQRNHIVLSGIDRYVEINIKPDYTMADFLNERYLEYLRSELEIEIGNLKKQNITVKEKISELKPLAEKQGLQAQDIYTKNEKNKLKKMLKFFLGEDGTKRLWVEENNPRSGYLISNYDKILMELLLDVLRTSNVKAIYKKFEDDPEVMDAIYNGFCTLAADNTNHLTKEFIDWRWSILFNAQYQKAMEALGRLETTITGLASIASDLQCNIEFWDYVRAQIEMTIENIQERKVTTQRSSPMSYKFLQDVLKKIEENQVKE